MSASLDFPDVLGLGSRRGTTEIGLADLVAAGFPLATLDRLVRALTPGSEALRYSFVPRPTLARRMKEKRFSPEESARMARVAGVFAMARDVWRSEDEARAFMHRRHPLLEDRTPLDVALANDIGARLVEKILGRLQHGTAA